MPKDDLIKIIEATGSDKYDKNNSGIFSEFYKKFNGDFFGTYVDEQSDLGMELSRLKQEFSEKTLGDRNESITPDLAIVYRADECRMVKDVYEEQEESDLFVFKTSAKNAFLKVVEI